MATLTTEQIEQKKQLLAEKLKEMKVISDELKDCGREMLSDDELDDVTGGDGWVWYDPGDGCEVSIWKSDDPCSPYYYPHETYAREYGL